MVRLTCVGKNCNHSWKETERQSREEIVYCPKCGAIHHSHTPPLKKEKLPVYRKEEKVEAKPLKPINPPEIFSLHQKGLDGRTVSFYKGYRDKKNGEEKK